MTASVPPTIAVPLLCIATVLAQGCSDDGESLDGFDAGTAEWPEHEGARVEFAHFQTRSALCPCMVDDGTFADMEACRRYLSVSPTVLECIESIELSDSVRDVIECELKFYEKQLECIGDPPTCESEAIMACNPLDPEACYERAPGAYDRYQDQVSACYDMDGGTR